MPLFEFECTKCAHTTEELMSYKDAVLDNECPSCHNMSLKKKVSASEFRLIGSGWYKPSRSEV